MIEFSDMANLQVKNVPEEMYERLRRLAIERKTTISATVLSAVEREIRSSEWRKRLETRRKTELGTDAATLVREGRAEAGLE